MIITLGYVVKNKLKGCVVLKKVIIFIFNKMVRQ